MCYADRALESVTELLRFQSMQQQNNIHEHKMGQKNKNIYMEILHRDLIGLKNILKHHVVGAVTEAFLSA